MNLKVRVIVYSSTWLLVIILPLLLTCCGKDNGQNFLYVSIQAEDRVAGYRIVPGTGSLEELESLTVEGSPACLTLHPSKDVMYVAQRSARTISSLGIDRETGALEWLKTIPAGNPVYLSTDKTGSFLLAAFNEPLPGIDDRMRAAIYRIGEEGELEEGAVQEISTGLKPHSITTDPSNRFLYIPCTNAEYIMQFRFDAATGKCTPLDPPVCETPPGAGPRHFAFHGEQNILYFVNETNGTVTGYRIDREDGTLSPSRRFPPSRTDSREATSALTST